MVIISKLSESFHYVIDLCEQEGLEVTYSEWVKK